MRRNVRQLWTLTIGLDVSVAREFDEREVSLDIEIVFVSVDQHNLDGDSLIDH